MSQFLTVRGLLLVVGVGIVVACAVGLFPRESPSYGRRPSCINHMKQIGIAMKMYAIDHEGQYPEDLFSLVRHGYIGIQHGQVFCCPSYDEYPPRKVSEEGADFACDYWYRPGFSERTAGRATGIVMDKRGNHTVYGNILFGDGHVKGFYGEEWYLNAGGMDGPPPENRRAPGKPPSPLGCGR